MPEKNEKLIPVRVRATPERGFFRAGRHWPHTETPAEVTAAELKQLKDEQRLVVVEVTDEVLAAERRPSREAELQQALDEAAEGYTADRKRLERQLTEARAEIEQRDQRIADLGKRLADAEAKLKASKKADAPAEADEKTKK